MCSPLNLHSILASDHDFAARSPINFAVSSSQYYSGDYTQQNHDQAALENLKIYTLGLNSGKTTITTAIGKHIYLLFQ